MAPWYYSKFDKPVGPLDEPQIFALIGQGKIMPATMVWREGMPQWLSAEVAGLIARASVRRPPPMRDAAPREDDAKYHAEMLDECRASIGSAPRDMVISPYTQLTPPHWLTKVPGDLLWEVYRQQNVLWRHGTVVWGRMIQANQLLFSPGANDCPASIIYSPHPWYDGKMDQLARIARALGAVKGKEHSDPEMMEFSRMLADERDRSPRMRVPKAFTGEYPAFHTSVMVVRKHLPHGYLAHAMFPILIEPHSTTAAIIVPCCYWSPALVAEWENKANPRPERVTSSGRAPVSGYAAPAPNMAKEADGQHKDYWVLSEAERAKGFVRPVRMHYRHDRCGQITSMSRDLAETCACNPKFYSSTFCSACQEHFPIAQFSWVDAQGQDTGQKMGS